MKFSQNILNRYKQIHFFGARTSWICCQNKGLLNNYNKKTITRFNTLDYIKLVIRSTIMIQSHESFHVELNNCPCKISVSHFTS